MTDRVKTSLFDSLNPYLSDALVLDLFAGVGGLGIEALSRGAAHCTFVERDRLCVDALRTNLHRTRLSDRATVYERDVKTALTQMQSEVTPVDIVLFDPPFLLGKPPARKELEALVQKLAEGFIERGGLLVYHHDDETEGGFETRRLDVVETRNYGRNRITILKAV
ncbi:MAG: Ribosomal RNA small subunit methyltransferase D [Candidatus Latescibacteria bacterium ADurb.Bin168]|nr:MAG: Ribosomal RNA small subunit methyltransferase D [Candidatus Latescibacteria bacterium ADurb.Bin168]